MKCDDLDKLVIFILSVAVINSTLGLFAGILSQRCNKEKEAKKEKTKNTFIDQLNDLERRVSKLENA